ncbi:MAG: hypothetical protein O2894_11320 [Planctomycetota bacterium]|nr:hypothetical protein [Planctomycetota bacterium]
MKFRVLALVLITAFGAPFAGAADEAPDPISSFLEGLTIGEGTATAELIIFPVLAAEAPEKLDIKPAPWSENVGYSEPDLPKRRFNVGVANNEPGLLLLLGGTILGGGHRDRVFPQDVLIPAGARVEIESIAAAPASDQRKEAAPFRVGSALAPPYIRERAEFSPTNTLVPNFVSHFLDFRNDGDERKSLSAVNASDKLTKLCLPCHESLAAFPTSDEGRVVGVVTAVRGRVRSLELFGDNRLLKAWFEPLLKSQTFAAAAIAVKAKKLRMELPDQGTADETMAGLKTAAEELLVRVQKAKFKESDTPKNSAGEYWIFRTSNSTRGAAISNEGRMLHMAVFPYEPFESALFGARVKAPGEDDDYGDYGQAELERKSRFGRLTEYEKRLLGRMRSGGMGLGGGGAGGGLRR